jgi:hypothetical protein
VCESKSSGWCSDSAESCSQCGPTNFYCPAASMVQQSSFLAPVHRRAFLTKTPMLIQRGSVLTRESGKLYDDDEL